MIVKIPICESFHAKEFGLHTVDLYRATDDEDYVFKKPFIAGSRLLEQHNGDGRHIVFVQESGPDEVRVADGFYRPTDKATLEDAKQFLLDLANSANL